MPVWPWYVKLLLKKGSVGRHFASLTDVENYLWLINLFFLMIPNAWTSSGLDYFWMGIIWPSFSSKWIWYSTPFLRWGREHSDFLEYHIYNLFPTFLKKKISEAEHISEAFHASFFLSLPNFLFIASRYWQEQIPTAIFCRTLSKCFILRPLFPHPSTHSVCKNKALSCWKATALQYIAESLITKTTTLTLFSWTP